MAMINGSPTDPNAADFKKGAHSVLDGSGFKIAAEFDTPDWSPDKAQAWMEGQLSAIKAGLVGVYAANDGTAGGAIAALKGGGVKPLPPVTGQDSELAAIQRIVAGDQAMTIYKAVKPQAEAAAKAAVALVERWQARVDHRQVRRPVDDSRPDRRHQGQHQRHCGEGRYLQGVGHLHRVVRGRLHRRRPQVTPGLTEAGPPPGRSPSRAEVRVGTSCPPGPRPDTQALRRLIDDCHTHPRHGHRHGAGDCGASPSASAPSRR